MLRPLRYLSAYIIPALCFWSFSERGFSVWIPVLFTFGLLPLLELAIGVNKINLDEEAERKAKGSLTYSIILYLFVPVQFGVLLLGYLSLMRENLVWWERAGILISVATSNGGIGITIAHELVHRKNEVEQWLGKLLLLAVGYMHFAIEHVYGHHKNVATPHDGASARFGESFYRFWPRSVGEQWVSAWNLERDRLLKAGKDGLSVYNQMIWFMVLPLVFAVTVSTAIGWLFAVVYAVQSVLAFSLLEAVNYLEHYGLERRERRPGKYEAVDETHSWNSDHLISRLFLFELTRHSDHHANASREYQVLRTMETSPQLPTGYPGMIVLALIPPVWFAVMNSRVQQLEKAG
jgi:alkane 1-monooxygenase